MHLKYKSGSSWVDYNLQVYPVGSVYMSYTSTSPASLFGGTWSAITGKFPYFNNGTGTGGSNSHTHGLGSGFAAVWAGVETPANLSILMKNKSGSWSGQGTLSRWTDGNGINNSTWIGYTTGTIGTHTVGTALGGNTDSGSNMPAYQTFYAWRRTA